MITYVPWRQGTKPDPRQPQGRPVIIRAEQVRATIEYLRQCQAARAAGYPVSYTDDPAWLVDMAINRRAGWPDDPSHRRGSCMPVRGRYPKRAIETSELRQFAGMLNTIRWRPMERETRWLPRWVRERIPHRIRDNDDY